MQGLLLTGIPSENICMKITADKKENDDLAKLFESILNSSPEWTHAKDLIETIIMNIHRLELLYGLKIDLSLRGNHESD